MLCFKIKYFSRESGFLPEAKFVRITASQEWLELLIVRTMNRRTGNEMSNWLKEVNHGLEDQKIFVLADLYRLFVTRTA